MLRIICVQVLIISCVCININAQEEDQSKKVSDQLIGYFKDSVFYKIEVAFPDLKKQLYIDWYNFNKKAIYTTSNVSEKRKLTKIFYRYYFRFPNNIDYYRLIKSFGSVSRVYFDVEIYEYLQSKLNRTDYPSNQFVYGCPNYHRIVSMYNLSKHKDYILKNNGMYWLEQPEEYVQNRLQFILNEFEQNAEVSKFSKAFLQELVALSNLQKDGYYKELIIKFFADAFSVIESKNTHKYSSCFMNVFVKDVLSINTDTDLIDKTCYMLNHIMPRSLYGPNRWYTFSFIYYDKIILKNIDYRQSLDNPQFREFSSAFGKEQGAAWGNKIEKGDFTWTDKLIKAIKEDKIEWHFYMDGK